MEIDRPLIVLKLFGQRADDNKLFVWWIWLTDLALIFNALIWVGVDCNRFFVGFISLDALGVAGAIAAPNKSTLYIDFSFFNGISRDF